MCTRALGATAVRRGRRGERTGQGSGCEGGKDAIVGCRVIEAGHQITSSPDNQTEAGFETMASEPYAHAREVVQ